MDGWRKHIPSLTDLSWPEPDVNGTNFFFLPRASDKLFEKHSRRWRPSRAWRDDNEELSEAGLALASAFFNRWLVADVPPGWQLVSQVLLALHITLPEGEWGGVGGEEEIIGGAGRECCSVKVHYSSHHVSWLQPRMAPGLTSLSPSSSRLHPSLLSSSASVTFRFHLSLHLSVFCLSLSRGLFWHRRIPLTPSWLVLNSDKKEHAPKSCRRCLFSFWTLRWYITALSCFGFVTFCDSPSWRRNGESDPYQKKWQIAGMIFPQVKCAISFSLDLCL